MMHEEDYEKKMVKKKRKFDKHQMPKPCVDSSHNNLEVEIKINLNNNFFYKKIMSLQNEYFFVVLEKLPPKSPKKAFKFDVRKYNNNNILNLVLMKLGDLFLSKYVHYRVLSKILSNHKSDAMDCR